MSNSHSIWTKLDRYPPAIVRALATSPWNRSTLMTDEMIRRRANGGLTLADIKHLSYAANWVGIAVDKMKAFCIACGVDFADRDTMRRLNRYLANNPRFSHLVRNTNFPEHRAMLAELLKT